MNCPVLNTGLMVVEITFGWADLGTGRLEAPKEKGGLKASFFCAFIVFSIVKEKFQFQKDGLQFYVNSYIQIMVLLDSRRIELSEESSAGV